MPQTQTLDSPNAPPPQAGAAPAADPGAQDPVALAQQIARQDYGIPPPPPAPNPAQMFGQSVAYGVTQNPDQYAKQLDLQKVTGVPPEIQNGSESDVEHAARMAAIHDLNLPQTAPKTAAWASNPDNAAVAHDDLGNLQQIEQGAATMRALTPWQKFDAAANQVVMNNPVSRAAVEAVGASVKMAGDVGSFFGWHGDGPTRENWLQQQARADMPETYGVQPTMVDKAAQFVGPMIPAMIASGGIAAIAGATGLSEMAARVLVAGGVGGMFSASQGGETFTQMAAAGNSDGAAERAALKAFGITLVPNMAMGMTDFVPALARHPLLASLGVGGATGAAGQVGQNVALGQQPWYAGIGKGALEGAAVMGGMHLGFGAFHATLGRIADAAEASKLRKRAPEAFQGAANAMFEGDGSLRVPAEAWVNYFEGKGQDAAAAAHNVGVSNLPEAIEAGSDLEIPKANWTARLAPEDQKGLIPDVVDPSSGMTMRQYKAAQQEAEEWKANGGPAKLQADLEQADAETQATPEWQDVYSDLKQRYVDAGKNENAADSYAKPQANAIVNLATREGMQPSELLAFYPHIVAGEAPGAVLHQSGEPDEPGYADVKNPAFVPAPNGQTHFGEITPEVAQEAGIEPGKLRLTAAGKEHIDQSRGDAIRARFGSIENFVHYVGQNFDSIYEAAGTREGKAYDIVVNHPPDEGRHGRLIVRIARDPEGDFWDIQSAMPIRPEKYKNRDALWERAGASTSTSSLQNPSPLGPWGQSDESSIPEKETGGNDETLYQEGKGERHLIPNKWDEVGTEFTATNGREPLKPGDIVGENQQGRALKVMSLGDKTASGGQWYNFKVVDADEARSAGETVIPNRVPERAVGVATSAEPRGWLRMKPDGGYEIGQTKIADPSTLVHEPAHWFLEMYRTLTGRKGASAGLQDDFKKIADWLGTTPEEARANGFTEEQHERWARATEKYVREGIAPSSDLRRAFHHFAVWLGSIYQRATDLKVEVSPEVRGVMDRLYAREGAVEHAERQAGEPLFKTPEEAGWTEEQFRNYAEARGIAVDKARQTVAAELNAAAEREKTEDFREEKSNVRDAVTEQLDARPEYTAIRSLRRGTMDDGTEIALNKDALVQQYGEDRVKALQQQHRGIYRLQGGVDAETAAEMFGFHSGEEMLRALEATPRRNRAIEAAVRDHLVNKYGDVRYDGTLNDRARFALESERIPVIYKQLRDLKNRLDKLEKKAADTKAAMAAIALPPLEAYQAQAHDIIQSKAMADIQPYRYLNASRKFSRDAFEAAGKGDARRAFEAKNKELLNHFLFREAASESEWVEKFEKYAQKSQSRGIQQRMALGDAEDIRNGGVGDTRAQYNGLLGRYKMGGGPPPERPLNDWAAQMYGDMMEPAIAHDILTGTETKDYRGVPLSELHDLSDALQNIQHLARMQYKVYVNGKLEDFNVGVGALVEGLRKNLVSRNVPVFERESAIKDLGDFLGGRDVANTRMEFLMNQFDGGTRGPWHDYIWNPYQDAKGREHALAEQVTEKLLDGIDEQTRKNGLRLLEKVMIPGLPDYEETTRKDLVSMALNLGNAGNFDRLQKTYAWRKWDPDTVTHALLGSERTPGMLKPEEWAYIQSTFEALKPIGAAMRELEIRQTGLPPKMVTVEPFTAYANDGTRIDMPGGYYPIQIDPADSLKGYQEEESRTARNLMQSGYGRPTTSRSYTKERSGFGGPLLFDYERVLSGHLTKAIKDITHREWMQSTYKYLTHPDVRNGLKETVGRQYEASMAPWLKSVVNDRNGTLDRGGADLRPLMEKVRTNLIRAGLTFKVSTGLEQFSHLPAVLLYTNRASFLQSILDFWKDPAGTTEAIRELSPNVMRFRGDDLSRDYNAAIEGLARKQGIKAAVDRLGMAVYKYNDHIWSFPLWNAVYRDSLLKDPTLPGADGRRLAVHDADAAVRMALGVGDQGDLPPSMRDPDMLARWATTMFSFDNLKYNQFFHDVVPRAARLNRAGRPLAAAGMLSGGALVTFVSSALLGSLATGNGPEKGENPAEWAIKRSLAFAGSTELLARLAIDAFEYGSSNLAESFVERAARVGHGMLSSKPDKDWTELGINALQIGGDATGTPASDQFAKTARYVHRAQEGKIENPSLAGALVGGGHK